MGRRVDARDVLDSNAKTRRSFLGKIVGHYRPTGPNAWDDYEFINKEEGEIDVFSGLKIQLELRGCRFRMRQQGRVIRVQWLPDSRDEATLSGASPRERHLFFIARCIEQFDEADGQATAHIAHLLRK